MKKITTTSILIIGLLLTASFASATAFIPEINAADRIGATSPSSEQELLVEEEMRSSKSTPAENQNPPQPAGFGKFNFAGGLGLKLWAWCTEENYNTMTLSWTVTQGKIFRTLPLIRNHGPWNDGIKFFYYYFIQSLVKTEFVLHIDYRECGSPRTITVTGKVIGAFVYGLQRI